MQPIHM